MSITKKAICIISAIAMIISMTALVNAESSFAKAKKVTYKLPLKGGYYHTGGYRENRGGHFNNGVDMQQTRKTNYVYAAAKGTVVQSGLNGGYGYSVTIKHDDGVKTLYAHLKKGSIPKGVKKGKSIKQGVKVGIMGRTGSGGKNIYPIHLKFSATKNGKSINPASLYNSKKKYKTNKGKKTLMQIWSTPRLNGNYEYVY